MYQMVTYTDKPGMRHRYREPRAGNTDSIWSDWETKLEMKIPAYSWKKQI